MVPNRRIVLAALAIAALSVLAGCLSFSSKEKIPVGALTITAPDSVYAHVYRDFPVAEAEEIILEGRIRSMLAAGSSWRPALTLYWPGKALLQAGHEYSGKMRATPFRGTDFDITPGQTWVHYRLVVNESSIQMWYRFRTDREWVLHQELDRPSAMEGVPAEIIVGKGFELISPNADYPNQHLDNSYVESKAIGVSYITDVRLIVDGEELFHEEFFDLEDWEIHFDPEYEDEITIEAGQIN